MPLWRAWYLPTGWSVSGWGFSLPVYGVHVALNRARVGRGRYRGSIDLPSLLGRILAHFTFFQLVQCLIHIPDSQYGAPEGPDPHLMVFESGLQCRERLLQIEDVGVLFSGEIR